MAISIGKNMANTGVRRSEPQRISNVSTRDPGNPGFVRVADT
jgi:hypothetical protein